MQELQLSGGLIVENPCKERWLYTACIPFYEMHWPSFAVLVEENENWFLPEVAI